MAISSFQELRNEARAGGPARVAIVCADDDVALSAAAEAMDSGLATLQLIGNGEAIRALTEALGLRRLHDSTQLIEVADPVEAARAACRMAARGESDILLKGHLRTDQLLRAVLEQESGLRTGRLLSDVMLYEDMLSGTRRLVGISDGGVVIIPTLDQKRQIVHNAIDVMHCLGIERPRIALMSATEAVSVWLPSTLEADELTQECAEGEFGDAMVFGPLALDNALLVSAAQAKGISNPVAGRADCLVVPNIESGNLLGKAVKYYGGSACAHVVVGARVPVLIPSRVESAEDKVNAMALGALFRAYMQKVPSEVRHTNGHLSL